MEKIWWKLNSQWRSKEYFELYWQKIDRINQILDKYWLKEHHIDLIELGNEYKIDYALVVCIARADSWLWTQLKTTNNIWNVGNNDRGNTVSYETLYDWWKAIFRVLHNKYLWHKQSIWSLSVWWWWNPPYYATSQENWNMNVLNCMSNIYNTNINENYLFRLQ
jgi:hypothetical protein